ncbi:hypothetical protein O6H91_05G099800 [Diphasiastrum complanatum]|uniref:Uncharacterized protein n=2 Tax=Diphasiastrum complanatum TaxID=34168 RepID=A0ACC2DRQ6_DIPCM|nr:hypothetical protein O6H91_05G099800 [Diphasiastrum complanatum]KAJ7556806.1 hypothetical protein O6H91_05G099800 [Diphasiastrum complanatum]
MNRLCILTAILAFLSLCTPSSSSYASYQSPVKAAYWPSYSADSHPASSINSALFTHLFYAFADLNSSTYQVQPPSYDDGSLIGGFSSAVRKTNKKVKTLISIGGGSSDWRTFSAMASGPPSRQSFIDSSIALARKYNFDGLDLDWEFPQSSTDMANLGTLFSEWRSRANKESAQSGLPPLLLTAAVYYASALKVGNGPAYPINYIAKNLNWVNIMAFDYHGGWEPNKTGEHTALYDPNSNISTNFGVGSWLKGGLPSNQAVLGLAMYGRSWILKNTSDTGIGAAAVGAGIDDGTPFYYQIVDLINSTNATVVYDETSASVFTYSDTMWIGFDDPRSISTKVAFLKNRGLLGYFFWTASFDYKWSLATAASQALT